MYLLTASYTKAPAEVEPHIKAHGEWVAAGLKQGRILFAGPKTSGLGGVIAVRAMAKTELMQWLAEDSYVQGDVADYQIVEIACKAAQPDFSGLLGT
jgi:uncharacterized protein YciI